MNRILIVATLSGLLFLPASAQEIPEGWRLATPEELDLEGYGISRTDSPHHYTRAEADFNGDGIPDIAYSLKSTSFSGEALVVRLSEGTEFSWKVLDETNWGEEYPDVGLAMGVDVAKPQKLQTVCGRGYFECSEDEPEEIDLKLPGIWYFKLESASSIFYWDKATNEFVRVWITD